MTDCNSINDCMKQTYSVVTTGFDNFVKVTKTLALYLKRDKFVL